MPNITIYAASRALFTPELRTLLADGLAPGNAANAVAVSQTYEASLDPVDAKSCRDTVVWTANEDGVAARNFYDAPVPVLRQAAACLFAAFGNANLDDKVVEAMERMVVLKDQETAYDALCLSFGLIIMDEDRLAALAMDAKEDGLAEITEEIACGNVAVLIDRGLSNHARIEACKQAENFLNGMVRQTLENRSNLDQWGRWLKDLTFTVVPK